MQRSQGQEFVAKQMKQLYGRLVDPATNKLSISIVPSAKQTNGSDCGVYAAAVAFEWANGHQQLPLQWDVAATRTHLLACLESQKANRFVQGSGKRGRRPHSVKVSV